MPVEFNKPFASAVVFELRQRITEGELIDPHGYLDEFLDYLERRWDVKPLNKDDLKKVSRRSIERMVRYLKIHGYLPYDLTPIRKSE